MTTKKYHLLIAAGLLFLLSREIFSVESGNASKGNAVPKGKSSACTFFTPQSFLDYLGGNPMFECREPLLRIYSKEVDSVLRLNKKITSNGPMVMENLNKAGCAVFDSSIFNYYGLRSTDNGNYSWQQIQLHPYIDFNRYDYCGDPSERAVAVNLYLQDPKMHDSLLLISGIPKGSMPTTVPDGFFRPEVVAKDTVFDSLMLNGQYREPYEMVSTSYSLPKNASNLKQLFTIDTIRMSQGYDTIAQSSSVRVVLKTGDTLKLFSDTEHGNSNQAYDAYVGNPYFVDADGNNLWDICFDTFEGKLLFLQSAPDHFDLRYVLRYPEVNCD